MTRSVSYKIILLDLHIIYVLIIIIIVVLIGVFGRRRAELKKLGKELGNANGSTKRASKFLREPIVQNGIHRAIQIEQNATRNTDVPVLAQANVLIKPWLVAEQDQH